jgi:hypothetical protein
MSDLKDDADSPRWEVRQAFQHLPFPELFTRAFGELMIEFAILEGELFDWVNELASDNYFHGAILLAGVPYTGLVDRFAALVIHLRGTDEALHARLASLRVQLTDVSERRNRLVHSTWLLEPIAGVVSRIRTTAKGRKGLHFDTPAVPVEELLTLRRDIVCARSDLRELGDEVFDAAYPK